MNGGATTRNCRRWHGEGRCGGGLDGGVCCVRVGAVVDWMGECVVRVAAWGERSLGGWIMSDQYININMCLFKYIIYETSIH
jgi:hypothetical protein